jgi:hypothetical protein
MMLLRVGRLRERWWVRGAVIAVALLALATGLCLFDQDEVRASGRVTPPDLCLGMLAVSFAIMPLVGLLAAGWVVVLPFPAAYAVAVHVPDPPPRSASLF